MYGINEFYWRSSFVTIRWFPLEKRISRTKDIKSQEICALSLLTLINFIQVSQFWTQRRETAGKCYREMFGLTLWIRRTEHVMRVYIEVSSYIYGGARPQFVIQCKFMSIAKTQAIADNLRCLLSTSSRGATYLSSKCLERIRVIFGVDSGWVFSPLYRGETSL